MSETQRRRSARFYIVVTVVLLALPWLLAFGAAGLISRYPALASAGFLLYVAAALAVFVYEIRLSKWTETIVRADRELTHDKPPAVDPASESEDASLLRQHAPDEDPAQQRFIEALERLERASIRIDPKERTTRLDLLGLLDRLQNRIDNEYSGIASRTAWLLTGQAFLIAAFVTILGTTVISTAERQWLAAGIAVAGAVISGVLSLSTYLGHALAARLKIPRDALEERLGSGNDYFPRSGVPSDHATYKIGHYATRYLPTFAYVAWISLVVAASNGGFGLIEQPTPGLGWVRYPEPSPSFPIGQGVYVIDSTIKSPASDKCADNTQAAYEWGRRVVRAWRSRRTPSPQDTLILVGGVDRLRESKHMSDTTLAETRAKTIQNLLIQISTLDAEDPLGSISERQVQRHVTGARHPDGPRVPHCSDPDLAVDRTVEVWIPD